MFFVRTVKWLAPVLLSLLTACSEEERSKGTTDTVPETECAEGELMSETGCVPERCGETRWGDTPSASGAAFFVDAAAASGGDGSEESAFSYLQDGLDAAGIAGGGVVFVAAGNYLENLVIDSRHASVELRGRCQELVILDGSAGKDQAGISVDPGAGAEVSISGVTLRDASKVGLDVMSGNIDMSGSLLLENLRQGVCVQGEGTSLSLNDVTIQDTIQTEIGTGVGVLVMYGATLRMSESLLTGNTLTSVKVMDEGSSAMLEQTVISGTRLSPEGWAYAVRVIMGSEFMATECQITGNAGTAVVVQGVGTRATLIDSEISATYDVVEYGAVWVHDRAYLEVEGCLFDDNERTAVYVNGLETVVEIRDSVISNTHRAAFGEDPFALIVAYEASLLMENSLLADNEYGGVGVSESGQATLDLVDILHMKPSSAAGGNTAVALAVEIGGHVDVTSSLFEGAMNTGVSFSGIETTGTLDDVEIRDVDPTEVGRNGQGLTVSEGAQVTLKNSLIEQTSYAGVQVAEEGSYLDLSDTIISQTRNDGRRGTAMGVVIQGGADMDAKGMTVTSTEGIGLYVVSDAHATCTDCEFTDSRGAAIALRRDSALTLDGCSIEGVSPDANQGGGVGIYAQDIEDLLVQDCSVTDTSIAGIWLSGPGSYQIIRSTVRGAEPIAWGSESRCGDAIYAEDGISAWSEGMGLSLVDNTLHDAPRAGLFLNDASASVDGGSWSANVQNLIVQGEGCDLIPGGTEDLSGVEQCPTWDHLTCDVVLQADITASETDG